MINLKIKKIKSLPKKIGLSESLRKEDILKGLIWELSN